MKNNLKSKSIEGLKVNKLIVLAPDKLSVKRVIFLIFGQIASARL